MAPRHAAARRCQPSRSGRKGRTLLRIRWPDPKQPLPFGKPLYEIHPQQRDTTHRGREHRSGSWFLPGQRVPPERAPAKARARQHLTRDPAHLAVGNGGWPQRRRGQPRRTRAAATATGARTKPRGLGLAGPAAPPIRAQAHDRQPPARPQQSGHPAQRRRGVHVMQGRHAADEVERLRPQVGRRGSRRARSRRCRPDPPRGPRSAYGSSASTPMT